MEKINTMVSEQETKPVSTPTVSGVPVESNIKKPMTEKDLMKVDPILPEDFDGTFKFTNWTDEDFVGLWGKKAYRFPAYSTCAIIIADQSPLDIQQIRKKFARDLAIREFGKSDQAKHMAAREKDAQGFPVMWNFKNASTYSIDQLAEYIQKCLTPLPESRISVQTVHEEPLENKIHRDDEGYRTTVAVDKNLDIQELDRRRKMN